MKQFTEEKQDPLTLRVLITKAKMLEFDKEIVKEIIEATLAHDAAESARNAMLSFGRSGLPNTIANLYDQAQTMTWAEILNRPNWQLNDLRPSLGESYGFAPDDLGEMHTARTASDWERILGVDLHVPSFLEAMAKYMASVDESKD